MIRNPSHLASLAVLAFLLLVAGGEALAGSSAGVSIGGNAPDFELKNLEGKNVCLADLLEDGPVLLDFWALWCKPCLKGLPGTNELGEEFAERGLTVVTVNQDTPRSMAKVRSYIKSKGYSFEVLVDPNREMQRLYHFRSIPQLFLVSTDGKIAYAKLGYTPGHEKKIAEEIENLLAAEAEEGEKEEE